MTDRSPLHGHHHGGEPPTLHRIAATWLWRAVALCGAVTVLAVLLLWPSLGDGFDDPLLLDADTISATVVTADEVTCSYDATATCRLIGFEMHDGPDAGEFGAMEHGAVSSLSVGDGIER